MTKVFETYDQKIVNVLKKHGDEGYDKLIERLQDWYDVESDEDVKYLLKKTIEKFELKREVHHLRQVISENVYERGIDLAPTDSEKMKKKDKGKFVITRGDDKYSVPNIQKQNMIHSTIYYCLYVNKSIYQLDCADYVEIGKMCGTNGNVVRSNLPRIYKNGGTGLTNDEKSYYRNMLINKGLSDEISKKFDFLTITKKDKMIHKSA